MKFIRNYIEKIVSRHRYSNLDPILKKVILKTAKWKIGDIPKKGFVVTGIDVVNVFKGNGNGAVLLMIEYEFIDIKTGQKSRQVEEI